MIITSVQIRKFDNTGNKMKGVCTLVLDDMIAIHDIKILENPRIKGLFFAMPSKKVFIGMNEGRFVDIVHPINKEVREKLEEIIFGLFKVVEGYDNTYVTFEITNRLCDNLLKQNTADFKIVENHFNNTGVFKTRKEKCNDAHTKIDIKDDIEAWLTE